MGSRNFGQLEEFNTRTDLWQAYVERANLYFQANDIREEKQLPVFLSSIGGKTYGLLTNLLTPTLPKDKPLAEVIAVLKKHFDPKPAVVAERSKFHKRDQLPGESLADYIAELRRLATHCEINTNPSDNDDIILVLGAMVRNSNATIHNIVVNELLKRLNVAITSTNNTDTLITLTYALGNSGSKLAIHFFAVQSSA